MGDDMITKDQVLEATLEWAKAELVADDCGDVVRTLYRATNGQPRPLPESEQEAIDAARKELTVTCHAGDVAFERMKTISRQYVEEQNEARAKAVAAS